MNYLVYGILAAVGFGFYNFFVGKSGGKISPFLATVLLSIAAATVAGLIIIVQKLLGAKIEITSPGIKFAVLAGLAAGVAEIFYFFAFTKNSNISVVLPVVFTITVVTGVILGFTINHEPVTVIKILGIVASLFGLFLLTR